jgi:hypothetical protein
MNTASQKQILKTLLKSSLDEMEKTATPLPSDVLDRLAKPNGLNQTADNIVEHLSLSPKDIREWIERLEQNNSMDNTMANKVDQPKPSIISSYGYLKAATTKDMFLKAITLPSQCGHYKLTILPQKGEPEKGLAILEADKETAQQIEGMDVSVWDSGQHIILQGVMQQGKVKQKIVVKKEQPLQLDSSWSVIIGL